MKVLHTADLHIGQTLAGRDRHDEQETVLREIVDIADAEEVDLVLVCGDLFHGKTPGPRSWGVTGRFLRLASGNGFRPVIVLAGNHDSADLLESLATFFALTNVRMITEAVTMIIASPAGSFQVAALPWIFEREAADAAILEGEQRYTSYGAYVARRAHEVVAQREDPTMPTILAMHAGLDGARVGVGERALHISETYAVRIADLPHVDYIAMGHFHRPQTFEQDGRRAVYPGSPFALDFGEREDEKRVVIVEFDGEQIETKSVPLITPRRLVDIDLDWLAAADLDFQPGDDWLRLTIRVPEPMPEVAAEARRRWPNAIQINVIAPDAEAEDDDAPELDRAPRDALRSWWPETHDGEPLPAGPAALFDRIMEEIQS